MLFLDVMHQASTICNIPREILDIIVYEVAVAQPLGPISNPLLFTCKFFHNSLTITERESYSLYSRIFTAKFDVGASIRRFGPRSQYTSNLASQCRVYCDTLDFIRRRGSIYSHDLEHHFMEAFLMLTESDGKNWVQLEHAGLPRLVNDFIHNCLWRGADLNAGWPEETTINSLALWLAWFTCTKERLQAESLQHRNNMIGMVMPYVHLAFRYPAFHAPDNHYWFPLPSEYENSYPASVRTAHGPWPLYRNQKSIRNVITHYGKELTFSTPLISQAAKLIYFSRREVEPIRIPPHLPLNREHALQQGLEFGPTQEDVNEFNTFPQAKLLPKQTWNWLDELSEEQRKLERSGSWHRSLRTASAKWDNDWERWVSCHELLKEPEAKGAVYAFGMMNGLWQGRLLVANEPAYMALATTAQRPPTFLQNDPFITGRPIYMRLREHHCIDPRNPVPVGGAGDDYDDGVTNGWFGPIRRHFETQGKLTWVAAGDDHEYVYETFVEGRPNSHSPETCRMCIAGREMEEEEEQLRSHAVTESLRSASEETASPPPSSPHQQYEDDFAEAGLGREQEDDYDDEVRNVCSGIIDIIFTGGTEERHGRAWDFYRYYGRVRAWDGLIALVRVRVDVNGHDDLREGRMVIRGYVLAGQNFVGTWRYWAPDMHSFPLEGPIVLSKRE
ncbi:hypothetical protein OE88DRAFT_1650405 [Heliocybe sulcata]|uniref:F-box domain-containing protein n=1 Tax=Heliocybe sulcata TaxID=5364 RepID=A0A5C3NHQ0_9AGAM|nr:hypothetical protein OE88DRAFT_1650405 [Heliocybe sulcata]